MSGGNIGEMAMHFIEKYGIMAVRIPSKFDMRRFCRATGAVALVKLQAPQPDELGFAKQVGPVLGRVGWVDQPEHVFRLLTSLGVVHGWQDVLCRPGQQLRSSTLSLLCSMLHGSLHARLLVGCKLGQPWPSNHQTLLLAILQASV